MKDTKLTEIVYDVPFDFIHRGKVFKRYYQTLYCQNQFCKEQIIPHIIEHKGRHSIPVDSAVFNSKKYCCNECKNTKQPKQKQYTVNLFGKDAAIQHFCFGG